MSMALFIRAALQLRLPTQLACLSKWDRIIAVQASMGTLTASSTMSVYIIELFPPATSLSCTTSQVPRPLPIASPSLHHLQLPAPSPAAELSRAAPASLFRRPLRRGARSPIGLRIVPSLVLLQATPSMLVLIAASWRTSARFLATFLFRQAASQSGPVAAPAVSMSRRAALAPGPPSPTTPGLPSLLAPAALETVRLIIQ